MRLDPIAKSCTGTTRCIRSSISMRRASRRSWTCNWCRSTRTNAPRGDTTVHVSDRDGAEPRHAHRAGRARRPRRSHRGERSHRSGRAQPSKSGGSCDRLARSAERPRRRRPGEQGADSGRGLQPRAATPRNTNSCWRSNRANRRCSMPRVTSCGRWVSKHADIAAWSANDARHGASPFVRRYTAM